MLWLVRARWCSDDSPGLGEESGRLKRRAAVRRVGPAGDGGVDVDADIDIVGGAVVAVVVVVIVVVDARGGGAAAAAATATAFVVVAVGLGTVRGLGFLKGGRCFGWDGAGLRGRLSGRFGGSSGRLLKVPAVLKGGACLKAVSRNSDWAGAGMMPAHAALKSIGTRCGID
jgi:hypothetical protein